MDPQERADLIAEAMFNHPLGPISFIAVFWPEEDSAPPREAYDHIYRKMEEISELLPDEAQPCLMGVWKW